MNRTLKRALITIVVVTLVLTPVGVIVSGVLPYRAYVVQTGSMDPTFPPTSLILVQTHEYTVGQVITFHKGNELVSHRLVKINTDGSLTTKGDANATNDPLPTRRADVIGGEIASFSGVGFWVVYLHNPLTVAALAFWAFAASVLWPRKPRTATEPSGKEITAA
jgi:signal peptidase